MNISKDVFPDLPESSGVKNALLRAKQLANLRWTPICPFPATLKPPKNFIPQWNDRENVNLYLPAWRPQTGANYSASRYDEKYIGTNVSIHTFMTALSNPHSVLYTRSLHGKHFLSSAFYGTVCSQFVSYILNMPFHIDCQQWPHLDGISKVNTEVLENLKLCDIINEKSSHIAIITGINRDGNGNVVDITVTESTPPTIITQVFSPKEFREYWINNNYEILRYHKTDKITYTPNPWVHLEGDPEFSKPIPTPALMPDYGDKANYSLGENVTISVFDSEFTSLEVIYGKEKTRYDIINGKVVLTPLRIGYYEIIALSEGKKSDAVCFCVTEASVTTDKKVYCENEYIYPSFFCESNDEHLGWIIKTDSYAKYWGYPISDSGVIPEKTTLPKGKYFIISLYKNKFGVYTSKPYFFDVKD